MCQLLGDLRSATCCSSTPPTGWTRRTSTCRPRTPPASSAMDKRHRRRCYWTDGSPGHEHPARAVVFAHLCRVGRRTAGACSPAATAGFTASTRKGTERQAKLLVEVRLQPQGRPSGRSGGARDAEQHHRHPRRLRRAGLRGRRAGPEHGEGEGTPVVHRSHQAKATSATGSPRTRTENVRALSPPLGEVGRGSGRVGEASEG
jgi:hypothetical protein